MARSRTPTLASRGFIMPTRLRASMSGAYESGSATGARSRNWNPSSAGPNSAAASNLQTIRRRGRDATRNDPWAKTASVRWVSNAIGTGIQPYPRHPDRAVRRLLKERWGDWVPEADADGRLDFYGQQALAARSIFTDGEALGRLRTRLPSDGLTVPLQLQCLEGDHLPVEKTELVPGSNEIVNGVEFDLLGRRVAYHMWSRHPGEYGRMGMQLRRVPADQVIHAYQVLRPGQVRGVSELATVLLRLKTLDNFDDAVAFRQEVANLFAGFITRAAPEGSPYDPVDNWEGGADDLPDADGTPVLGMEPGTLNTLADGEDIKFATPPGAPDSYAEFMRQQLMAAFASVGIPYELGTGDLRGVSDRTLRVLVNEFHRLIEQYQWTVFIHQWCRPVWNAWLEALVLDGSISASDYLANRRLWRRVLWVPQGWEYFNPVQDVNAKQAEVRAGFTSRSAVILAQGEDPDEVMEWVRSENDAADAAGLMFDSDSRHPLNKSGPARETEPDGEPAPSDPKQN
ncbi:MAG: phage portal protein [Alcaligenaceae bacterium]|nr:phage portal protein [Alcaligenaceae bacterium SAGV5]MPS50446.1 phage portal protein [Alcaligenaceae bacterium SAGV3]MPT57893.1 phage portal protein [Alcaligenaceae bacterium]